MMHNAYWSLLPDLFAGNEFGLPQRGFYNGQVRFMSLTAAEVVRGTGIAWLAESEAPEPEMMM
ncbi:MAG: hypothetical protein U5K32_11850 [Bacteroidales bacterium]|nr:hypothetical protein [Bacteroidales bacterium]